MSLSQKLQLIKSGKLTAVENLLNFIKKIDDSKDLNIFLVLNEHAIQRAREIDEQIKNKKEVGKLAGLCFAVKSNICVKGIETNCASKVLEGFLAPYNATVIEKLLEEDAIIIGMANMDEFACGASGETSAFGPTKNPKNPELIPGGSSSGPAASIAAGLCDFALGSDTGGSIRNPASHCGVVGLKPTYGAISRYGLIDLSMSFDCIGPLTNSVEDAKIVFDVIKGQDNFDLTTLDKKNKAEEKRVIGLVNVKNFCDEKIAKIIEEKTRKFAKANGYKIKEIDLPLDIAIETYYIIVYTEFFSGTRKFDGRRFGKKIEDTAGPEVQRRIIGGSEITKAEHEGKYYREALRAREHIKEQFEKIFQDVNVIVLPTVPKLPHKIGSKISVEEMYAYDIFTVLANIAGLPAISVPTGKIEGKNVGLQLIAPHFAEEMIFEIGRGIN
ncbi:MAG: Asp-tRNA(Asn)/Glu-tRNA(Gln) amidotransferase subunit GatA [Candidatus Pacearchaeota archaeon]